MDHETALLLNASYEPIRVINWKKAFILMFLNKAEALEYSGLHVHSFRETFAIPSVIRLHHWIYWKRKTWEIKFSRQNVYVRDNFVCQYCHKTYPEKELTLDHVVPASKQGPKSWSNIVTACKRCNQKKGSRTPKEASMSLLKKPSIPRWLPLGHQRMLPTEIPEAWHPYVKHFLKK